MRNSMLFLPFLAALVAAVPLQKRQGPLSGYGDLLNTFNNLANIVPYVKSVRKEVVKPLYPGDDVKRVQLSYGPLVLGAANNQTKGGNYVSLDPQGTAYANFASDFPSDITILGAGLSMNFADGTPISNANGVYNHHAFLFDTSKPMDSNLQCLGSHDRIAPLNAIASSGADAGNPDGPPNFTKRPLAANYIPKGHKILFTTDLVNYNKEPKEVYLTVDFQYIEGKAPGFLETTTHLVSAGSCAAKTHGTDALNVDFPKDKKQFTLQDNEIEIKDDGKLLFTKGHLHDGGVNMIFKLNGEQICNSRAAYSAAVIGSEKSSGHAHMGGGMLSGMTECPMNRSVKKGDKISVEAFYDLEKHPSRPHVDGEMSEGMALAAIVIGTPM